MILIKNIYNTAANSTGIIEMTSEKAYEATELLLDEQMDMFINGREARLEKAKQEEEAELIKMRIKTEKLKHKLNAKLLELEALKAQNQPQS